MHAHRAFEQFAGSTEAEFLAWLKQILVNRLTSLIRRYSAQRRAMNLERKLQSEIDASTACMGQVLAAPGSSPSAQFAKREFSVLLADALQQLSQDHREVIILHQFEGLKFSEVGERLGKSEAAAQKSWIRALVQLRRIVVDPSR